MNKEGHCLGEIAAVFALSGRQGMVVVPVEAWHGDIRMHEALRLVRPDGTAVEVQVGGIEMTNPSRFDGRFGLYLKADPLSPTLLSPEDVPVGSTLWRAE